MGFPQNKGYHFGSFYSKDDSVWESSPYFGKLPNELFKKLAQIPFRIQESRFRLQVSSIQVTLRFRV